MINGFIQTGDIHIGECRTLTDYLDRHKGVLSSIIDIAEKRNLMIVDTGDLFHARNTKFDEKFLAEWWLSELELRKIPSIHSVGNHDHLAGSLFQLKGYEYLSQSFTYTKIFTSVTTTTVGDIGFIVIPWGDHSKSCENYSGC